MRTFVTILVLGLMALTVPTYAAEPVWLPDPALPEPTPTAGAAPTAAPAVAPAAPAAAPAAEPVARPYQVYTPLVRSVCFRNAREEEFARLVRTAPDQGRTELVCDPILQRIALEHARDMMTRCYFAHRNPEGLLPPDRARRAGYIPDTRDWLNVAEILIGSGPGGVSEPNEIVAGFRRSPGHRNVMLAQGPAAETLRAETRIGVAMLDDTWSVAERIAGGNLYCGAGNTTVVFAAPSGGYPPYRRTAAGGE